VNTASTPPVAPAGTTVWRITTVGPGAFVGYLYRSSSGGPLTWWIVRQQIESGCIGPENLRFLINTEPVPAALWATAIDAFVPHPYPPSDRGNQV
jgi:hypothetical protein